MYHLYILNKYEFFESKKKSEEDLQIFLNVTNFERIILSVLTT